MNQIPYTLRTLAGEEETRQGEAEFFVSDRAEDFERIASVFLQEELRNAARRIDIDQY